MRDAPHVLLLRDIVRQFEFEFGLHNYLQHPAGGQISALSLPDRSGSNSPKGCKARMARSGSELRTSIQGERDTLRHLQLHYHVSNDASEKDNCCTNRDSNPDNMDLWRRATYAIDTIQLPLPTRIDSLSFLIGPLEAFYALDFSLVADALTLSTDRKILRS